MEQAEPGATTVDACRQRVWFGFLYEYSKNIKIYCLKCAQYHQEGDMCVFFNFYDTGTPVYGRVSTINVLMMCLLFFRLEMCSSQD